jgi:ribosome-binding protein aMBF1 (putative translation factor)
MVKRTGGESPYIPFWDNSVKPVFFGFMEKTIFSQAYDEFCRVLRETRQAKGITQAQMAKALGRPQSFVAKIEGGERRVDVVEFLALADCLKELKRAKQQAERVTKP